MQDPQIRVLLVDDEADLVDFLGQRFRARGFSVVCTTGGDEALEVASNRIFDVAVVDLKMPGLGGLETLERLKELQPMLEVIILTGYGTFGAAHQSGRLNALRFLEKPCDFESLLGEVQSASEFKRLAQRVTYRHELNALVGESLSPRDIIAMTEQLRKKYEQR